MENKPLLSIAIPTYNRAVRLKNLLDSIAPQAIKLGSEVEICISDNNSPDNTREVVMNFKEKYPGLIKYNENKENIGGDKNFLKVLEMSRGDFVWLFGDDDLMADGGLNEVISFIKNNKKEKIGLVFVRTESYFFDKKTGQKTVWSNKLDKNKPEIFKMDKKEIIGMSFPEIAFMSALVFNNKPLKQIFKEDRTTVEEAIKSFHIHMILLVLMFLKYPHINGFVLNKRPLIYQELFCHKLFVEDRFMVHYQAQKKFNNLLLFCGYMSDNYAPLIIKRDKKLRRDFIIDMMVMRAFKNFNCFSYFGCLKLFFQQAMFADALFFSFVFLILFLIPPIVLSSLYKILLIIKYGRQWRLKWNIVDHISSAINKAPIREIAIPINKKKI